MSGETLSNLRAAVTLVLLGLSIPSLALAYARAIRLLRADGDVAARRLFAASTIAGAVVRWVIAPKQIVTMYIGYLLTQQAIELSAASHYGMGSLALYHALFAVLPRDHRTLLWANAVIGALTIPLAATFAARILRSPRAGAVFAALVALTPLFIKNDASDANQVPCLWWLFGGLVLWEEYLDTGARPALAAAVPLVALAASARPEMPLLLPILFALLTLGLPRSPHLRRGAVAVAAIAAAILVVPHALHVLGAAATLEERDSLPGASAGGLKRLVWAVAKENTVLTPSLYPLALTVLAVIALAEPVVLKSTRAAWKGRVALAIAAVIALATYGLDLCRANMARVHVPGALLVTMLAAAAIASSWRRGGSRGFLGGAAIMIGVSAVPTAMTLWAPTNEQAEEDFLRVALSRLPHEAYTLVRMDRADRDRSSPGSDFTHHHFPDYLVRPPAGTGRVSSIVDWIDQPDFDRPAYFYLGMRCYAEFRPGSAPRPQGDAMQAACKRMQERFTLEPVIETTATNRGDVWLEYYGDAPSLRMGLYRIRP